MCNCSKTSTTPVCWPLCPYFPLDHESTLHLRCLPDFEMSFSEDQTFRLPEEVLHSKVGTVSLIKQMPALKLGQDSVFCRPPSVANSLPDEAISASSRSCIA